jgi:AcrR family transcriptional regulator
MVEATRALIALKGSNFTTQEVVKKAGVSLQTLYRYFPGKDQLILAVFEHLTEERSREHEASLSDIDNPLERLRLFVESTFEPVTTEDRAREVLFMATEHWRLERLYPEELDRATSSFTRMVQREIEAAVAAGLVDSEDPESDAWLISQLVRAVYHSYAFATSASADTDATARLWAFCLKALGASPPRHSKPATRSRRKPPQPTQAGRTKKG